MARSVGLVRRFFFAAGAVRAAGLPDELFIRLAQNIAMTTDSDAFTNAVFNRERGSTAGYFQHHSGIDGFRGHSFAMPVAAKTRGGARSATGGGPSHGSLGIIVQDLTRDLARAFGTDRQDGVVVVKVVQGGPAANAGFKPGDIITDFAGRSIARASDLAAAVWRTPADRVVRVRLLRNGRPLHVQVRLAERPSRPLATNGPSGAASASERNSDLGLSVAPVGETHHKVRRQAGGGHGVLVRDVTPGPAFEAGVRRDDVVLTLNGADVDSPDEFHRLVDALPPGRMVPMLIERHGGWLFLAVKVPE